MKRLDEETRKIVYKETVDQLKELGFEQLNDDMFKAAYETCYLYVYLPMTLAFSDKMEGATIEEFSAELDVYSRSLTDLDDLANVSSLYSTRKRITFKADTLDELLEKIVRGEV